MLKMNHNISCTRRLGMYSLTAVGRKRHVPVGCTDSQLVRLDRYANVSSFWQRAAGD
jgi:hypothetical protein